MNNSFDTNTELAIKASIKAGLAIMDIYRNNDNFELELKKDNSPLTKADKTAHKIIVDILKTTQLPVLSEEGENISYEERKSWKTFWLVDPLDGTKEFINKNGEFTVNIALIEKSKPVMGIIYAPVLDKLYVGGANFRSFMVSNVSKEININDKRVFFNSKVILPKTPDNNPFVIAASRSHINKETKQYIESIVKDKKDYKILNIGSSLKFCVVAENKACVYPRFGPTMEWDVAAGHAIVLYSNGDVINAETKQSLVYNKKELVNPNFIAQINKNVF